EAASFIEEKLGNRDVSRLFLERGGNEAAVGEELLACYEEAVPEPPSTGTGRTGRPTWERAVLATPHGEGAEQLRSLMRQKLADSELTLADSEDDIIFYREWSDMLLADVDPLGPAGQEAYELLCSKENFTPHTRIDVAFESR